MSATKILVGAYFAGIVLFIGALIIIGLRVFEVSWAPSPTLPLFAGIALIIISKLLARPLGVGVEENG